MLPLLTRRVALSARRTPATYTRIVPTLRARTIPDTRLHIIAARKFTNPQRDASTKATATTKKTKLSTKPTTTGRTKPKRRLTPEQKEARKQALETKKELDKKKKAERAAALRAKQKAQAEKQKEVAAQKRKRLTERKKRLVEARKAKAEKEKERKKAKGAKAIAKAKAQKEEERKKAREAKKPKLIKPPPRRISGFALFIQEARKNPQQAVIDWRNLSEEGRQEYVVRAKAVAAKRKEDFDAFAKTVTWIDVVRYNRHQKAKGADRIRIKFPRKPRPQTSFMRYIQNFRVRPDQVGKRPADIAKAAGEAWRSLTQEEKDQYKHEHTETATA